MNGKSIFKKILQRSDRQSRTKSYNVESDFKIVRAENEKYNNILSESFGSLNDIDTKEKQVAIK